VVLLHTIQSHVLRGQEKLGQNSVAKILERMKRLDKLLLVILQREIVGMVIIQININKKL